MKKITTTLLLVSLVGLMPLVSTGSMAASMPAAAFDAELAGSIELADFNLADAYELAEPSGLAEFGACPSGTYRVRNHTSTKKKVIHSAVVGGVATAIGAGIGGKRGALIGAGSGVGGYLTYRYFKDRHGRCVRRYTRR